MPLLSVSNPARLSRAEFRVCVLLSKGLNTSSVCSELSISISTLRTHLRNIFAKTKVTSMAELLCLLPLALMSKAQVSETTLTRRG
ncbi:helix-turn-helix transcriptional regulator [Rubellimicrobium roseum]|uniref:HTH luxR-type domain-containing protein n=1 Tax=Rubellimicrobium roseum TaxID=687525 RepID=A0A5C4NB03_9RHOB|nr:hypothetical protein FHG71_19190 [Rubellimicrobium roseum]